MKTLLIINWTSPLVESMLALGLVGLGFGFFQVWKYYRLRRIANQHYDYYEQMMKEHELE